jgi:hypothetical protein
MKHLLDILAEPLARDDLWPALVLLAALVITARSRAWAARLAHWHQSRKHAARLHGPH